MSSFIQTTQQATTDRHDKKFLSLLKTYTFFIFYDVLQKAKKQHLSIFSKVDFKIKESESTSSSHIVYNNQQQMNRQIQIHFYDVNNQNDILNSISDIRSHSSQSKAKIILNCSQQKLSLLIEKFQIMKMDFGSIPILINSNQYKSDISQFLGWRHQATLCMANQGIPFYQQKTKQWIKAATERIDVWQVKIMVSKQKGRILKLVNEKLQPVEADSKFLTQYFISHFCIGYHATLFLNCKQKIKENTEDSLGNSFISTLQKLKKFCCVGNQNMKQTTGIATITLVDEKGEQLQILKQLKCVESSSQETQNDLKRNRSSKYQQYKDVLSILLTNLNIYQSNTLSNSSGKISDGKLQLLTFDSVHGHRKICSSPGQIKIRLETEMVDIQIGESCYRLEWPQTITINLAKKVKVGINNELVKC